jgi:hypothetical protein
MHLSIPPLLLILALAASQVHAFDSVKMLCLVNAERVRNGLSELGTDARLDAAAQVHSDDQASRNVMTHDGSDGSSPAERVQEQGFDWQAVAENVAFGYSDEETCMEAWIKSPGHHENILGPYTHFGSAESNGYSNPYFTQDFASDSNTPIVLPDCSNTGSSGYGEAPTAEATSYAASTVETTGTTTTTEVVQETATDGTVTETIQAGALPASAVMELNVVAVDPDGTTWYSVPNQ